MQLKAEITDNQQLITTNGTIWVTRYDHSNSNWVQ